MGKRSKRTNRLSNRKIKARSPLRTSLLDKEALLAITEKEPGSDRALACYARLVNNILMEGKDGDGPHKNELRLYIDRINEIIGNSNVKILPMEVAFPLLFGLLRLGDIRAAMEIYRNQSLKRIITMRDVLYAAEGMEKRVKEPEVSNSIIEILEDHKHQAAEYPHTRELHDFYAKLAVSYGAGNRFIEERENLQKQLIVAKNMEDHTRQIRCLKNIADNCRNTGKYDEEMDMLKACMELLSRYMGFQSFYEGQMEIIEDILQNIDDNGRKTGRYDEAMDILKACMENLSRIKSDPYITRMKAAVFFKMGVVIKTRSVTEHGVILHCDAVAALDMFKKATELGTMNAKDFVRDQKTPAYLRHLGRSYGDVGDYEKGIEEVLRSREIIANSDHLRFDADDIRYQKYRKVSEGHVKSAFQNACEICLQEFYRRKSLGEPFEETVILRMAEDYIRKAMESMDDIEPPACHPPGSLLILAQVYYFLHETSKAYEYLALFLDDRILKGGLSCGACHQKNSKHVVRNICSGCNSTYYCSSICQSLHWKTNIAGMIRHKDLCPLIKFWRKAWKKYFGQSKGKCNNESWIHANRDSTELVEFISDHCAEMFESFFEGLLHKEHGPVGYFDAID